MLRAALLACATFVSAVPAGAQEYRLGDITIGQPWTRAVGATAPTAAGYLSIANGGAEADRLVAAETPRAQRVELHEMSITDGIMRMRPPPDGVPLPAGGTVTLAPGGLHLMLVDPVGAFVRGTSVPLTLRFERAGEVIIELEVAGPGARGPAAQHGGH
jgi:copper(I)-binding protein